MSDLESFSSDQGDIRESSSGQTAHQRARDCMIFGDLLPPTLDDKEEGDGMDDRDDNRASHCGSKKAAPLIPHGKYKTRSEMQCKIKRLGEQIRAKSGSAGELRKSARRRPQSTGSRRKW